MTPSIPIDEENRMFAWFEATTGRSWDSLSEVETAAWRAYLFELQVANGGFHQALLNDGDKWGQTLHALRRIEAVRIAQMFEKALSVFPNGAPANDDKARYAEICGLGTDAVELLDRLTGEYYDLYRGCPAEDFYSKMRAYLKREHLIE